MLCCPGPALCSAFLLVLKCIAYQESRGKKGGKEGGKEGGGGREGLAAGRVEGGVLSYSGDELTLLCKRLKVI